jgi:serine/threonine-protein kinase
MERVHGENLATLIRRGPLPIASAVEMARQLLHGLSALEEHGIVHRDIKPDNLMLHDTGDGMPTVKLVDFGIAKRVSIEPQARLTCHGALIGTPQYMSPEQIRGEDVDVRTDIYATGAVLYEALTGHAPHESGSFSELVVSVLGGQVVPVRAHRANCPAELERIVLKALSPQPAQRHGSPRLLLEALDRFARDFALPRGADAFAAADCALPMVTPGRRSLAAVQKPAQLALIVLLLSTPGQVRHVQGATPLSSVEASNEVAISVSGDVAADAPVHRVAPASARPYEGRAATKRQAPIPTELHTSAARQLSQTQEPSAEHALVGAERAVERAAERALEPTLEPAATKTEVRGVLARAGQRGPAKEPNIPSHAQEVTAQPERSAQLRPASTDPRPPGAALDPARRQQLDATLQAALAALVRGRLDAAHVEYARAVKLAPGEPAGYRGLGLVAARLGENREARAALGKYLVLAPRAPDAAAIRKRLVALP